MLAYITALSSLIGSLTVAFLAISARLAAKKAAETAERAKDAAEASKIATETLHDKVEKVETKIDANNVKLDVNTVITKQVVEEVKTTNGIPIGLMLEREEGRRIEGINPGQRTPSEQEYVNKLKEGGRNMGHPYDDTQLDGSPAH